MEKAQAGQSGSESSKSWFVVDNVDTIDSPALLLYADRVKQVYLLDDAVFSFGKSKNYRIIISKLSFFLSTDDHVS